MWLKVAVASVAVNALLGWLLLQANQAIGRAEQECNTRIETARADSERAVRERLTVTYEARLDAKDELMQITLKAWEVAHTDRLEAERGVESRDAQIAQLEIEAFDEDEIPDSGQCLSAFVPSRNVERMFWDKSCPGSGDSGDPARNRVCRDSSGVLGADAPAFSLITFGDSLRAWNHDRAALRSCNADKRAIEVLNETSE